MLKCLLILLALFPQRYPQIPGKNPVELGTVQWYRNLEEAQKIAIRNQKPIFILFQEIPGCSTCKNYGSDVLSHPLIAEAIENYFVPLAIHNNKSGSDQKTLEYFKEPSWNNPVVRIVQPDLSPLVDRLSGNYTSFGLVAKINAALLKNGHKIPDYLKLLEEELMAKALGTEKVIIGMFCFWSGEKNYGQIDGVIGTRAGFMNGAEVVEVKYNPKRISLEQLIAQGKKSNNADRIYVANTNDSNLKNLKSKLAELGEFKVDPELKYYIYNSSYKYVPMSELQATKINSLLGENKNPDHLLSPNQKKIHEKIKIIPTNKLQNLIGLDLYKFFSIADMKLPKS